MLSSPASEPTPSLPPSGSATASGAEMLAQNADPAVPVATKARLHLPYLDGIRALMALYVVHHHLMAHLDISYRPFRLGLSEVLQMFYEGHYAVAVFIVLSGYCLMLPVLRDGGILRGGLKTFFSRRARRILPPYYAALFGGALLLAVEVLLYHRPVAGLISPERWVFHLLLIHNLSSEHIFDFNGALWSIATEWQIYFFFPFLFLPIWKRFGEGALLLVATVVALAVTVPFPSIAKGCPWFIALFAFGMVAAKWSMEPSAWMKRVPWAWLGFFLTIAMYFVVRLVPAFHWFAVYSQKGRFGWFIVPDVVIGIATFCFLLHGTRATLENRRSKFVSMLTWRPLVFIGAFSYSLYLIHMPIQSLAIHALSPLHLSRSLTYGVMLLVGFPLTLALAYGFYLLFEKPFLGALKPKGAQFNTSIT